jgi:hypothetical protein
MNLSLARGMLRGALVLAFAVVSTAAGATAAQAAAPRLSLTALAFEKATVDASSGEVVDDLTWTIKNTDPDADGLSGTVTFRMRSSITGAFVGHERVATFEYERTCCNGAEYVSGTPQESTYRYSFVIPRWADASTTTWEVTNVSATDNGLTLSAGAAKLAGFASKVVATTSSDTGGPSFDMLALGQNLAARPYVYVAEGAKNVRYELRARDNQSGFWKGTLKLAGPGGQSVTTPFTWEYETYSTGTRCGSVSGGDLWDMSCTVDVTLPAGAAAGSWRVAQLILVDNAGARSTYKNPQSPPITVTSNAAMSASGFAIDPVEADNWRNPVTGTVSFDVAGARRGVSSVALDFDTYSCSQRGGPSQTGAGVSVQFLMQDRTAKCTVTGIAVIDGTGAVSLYGSAYGAPDPGLTVRRIPNTTPPVVTGAALDRTSLPASEAGWTSIGLTIQAEVLTAPISSITTYLYDSAGTRTQLSFGGIGQAADGSLVTSVYLPYWQELPPGDYTFGFMLSDEGGLSSKWGMPDAADSHDIPGGQLALTLTEG